MADLAANATDVGAGRRIPEVTEAGIHVYLGCTDESVLGGGVCAGCKRMNEEFEARRAAAERADVLQWAMDLEARRAACEGYLVQRVELGLLAQEQVEIVLARELASAAPVLDGLDWLNALAWPAWALWLAIVAGCLGAWAAIAWVGWWLVHAVTAGGLWLSR